MAQTHQWTIFGTSNKFPNTRLLHSGAQRTEEEVRRFMANHHRHFAVSSVHPGHVAKPPEPPAASADQQ